MGALDSTMYPTLADWQSAIGPNNEIADVIEILNQENMILQDIPWKEGNLPTGERTTIRTELPEGGTWRGLYERVKPVKSGRAQIEEHCGFLEAYNEVDMQMAKLGGADKLNAFRMDEARATLQGITHQVARELFHADLAEDARKFTGLAPRYNDLDSVNSQNILEYGAGTAASNFRSIWLVCWGPNVYGIVPQGVPAGIQWEDLGSYTSETGDGFLRVYLSRFEWSLGLVIRDWRYVVRICNIPKAVTSYKRADRSSRDAELAKDLIWELMYQALMLVPSAGAASNKAFYMGKDLMTFLSQSVPRQLTNSTLTFDQVGGVSQVAFHGVPFREVAGLGANEVGVR